MIDLEECYLISYSSDDDENEIECHHFWRQLSYYSYIISRMTYKQCYVVLNLILKLTYDKDTVNNLTHIRFIIPLTSSAWEEGFWIVHMKLWDPWWVCWSDDDLMRRSSDNYYYHHHHHHNHHQKYLPSYLT